MHDMVIKGGTVVDGTGDPSYQADIAIDDGRISEIGRVTGGGREVIDADGLLVTPGFVDTHTHYDGQASWDPLLTPSIWHGVTTVTMGNCGVGFAPVRRGQEEWLISLMEGVEDIPGTVLSEGMRWEWETFPQYLDFLDTLPLSLDVTCQIPHGPLRAYAMGERGASNEVATDEDMARMAAIVGEAIEAGAYAFTTSRTLVHKSKDGKCVPGTFATEAEIFAIAAAMKKVGRGVFEVAQLGAAGEGEDPVADTRRELDWMRRVSEFTGQNVVYTLEQVDRVPELWREMLKFTDEANAAGAKLRAMTAARPIGALIGFKAAGAGYSPIAYFNPLRFRPSYKALVELPLEERLARMRDPEVKARILAESPAYDNAELGAAFPFGDSDTILARYYPLTEPLDYEPDASKSIVGLAAAEGRQPMEYFYDRLVADGGETLFLVPLLNYTYGNGDALLEMMKHPANVLGLGDGGAHCQNLCDASNTTYMLTHWVRDRARGERVPLEWAVRKLTLDPAQSWGLHDRGRLAVGLKADLNVIDFANLNITPPRLTADLPAGGSRVLQRSEGYVATINSGQVIVRDSTETEARPGGLVRSGR